MGRRRGTMGQQRGNRSPTMEKWTLWVFSSCRNCLCGYFCPCCLMCENAKRLEKSQCLHCLLFCLMPCIPTLITRGEVRELYQIEGSVAGDVCAACCCTCCATVQVANELDHYGK